MGCRKGAGRPPPSRAPPLARRPARWTGRGLAREVEQLTYSLARRGVRPRDPPLPDRNLRTPVPRRSPGRCGSPCCLDACHGCEALGVGRHPRPRGRFPRFAAATFRLTQVASPVLARTTIAPLVGLIEALDSGRRGAPRRVGREFRHPAAEQRPRRVRVSFRKAPPLKPGDRIAATAPLLPPPEAARRAAMILPATPTSGDRGGGLPRRHDPGPAPAEDLPPSLRLAAAVDDARNALTRRITDANGGQAGAVAAAQVTGKRGLINGETNDVLRAAGIYHVVSISGLHMVLAAASCFWLVRALLALVPSLACAGRSRRSPRLRHGGRDGLLRFFRMGHRAERL